MVVFSSHHFKSFASSIAIHPAFEISPSTWLSTKIRTLKFTDIVQTLWVWPSWSSINLSFRIGQRLFFQGHRRQSAHGSNKYWNLYEFEKVAPFPFYLLQTHRSKTVASGKSKYRSIYCTCLAMMAYWRIFQPIPFLTPRFLTTNLSVLLVLKLGSFLE